MRTKTSGRVSRKRVGYVALGLAVAIVAALAFYSIYHTPSSSSAGVARTVKVTRGTVQSSVSASGNLSTVSTASENFVSGGTLTTFDASVGKTVKAGQVLATIDSSQESSALQAAETTLTVAKMNDKNAQTSGTTLQRNLNNAKSTLATDQSGGTAVQQDQNQSTLDTAQQQLTNNQNQLTSDQALLTTDEDSVATAQATYSSDELLGCPAASSGTSGPSSGPVTASAGSPPSVSTGAATSVSTTSAVLNATVNPNGAATTYYFEYGTSTAYGLSTASFSLAAGSTSTQVSATVTGLNPSTTYLFNVVATNTVGGTSGSGVTLSTPATSCTADAQVVATDQTKVSSDQSQLSKDNSAITVQALSVQIAQANLKASPTAVSSDKSAITQDESSIAQSRVSLVQDQEAIAQDEVSIEQAEKTLQQTQLVALISGTVTSASGSVGQVVSGGGSSTSNGATSTSSSSATGSGSGTSSSLVTIQGLRTLQVVASFAEADAIKIEVHQTATITLASLPNTEVRGMVTAVAQVSTVVNNVVTYPVSISLIDPPTTLKDGMTAQVAVIVQTASNVLELPSAAITTTGSLSTVKILVNGVQTTTPVTLGLVGSSFTQVTSGVSEGQTIVEPTATVSATTSGAATTPTGGFGGRGFGGGAP
jgi:multidrug efflux pump subunit AcrA (membrane-fusion protein)